MATRQLEPQVFVIKFCFYIDELLQAWDTANDINYLVQPDEPGGKANYCAIKLGLTVLGNKLPYEHEKWWYNSTPKGTKEKYPDLPQELQNWKKRAKALGPDTTLYTLNLKTHITKEKAEKFLRAAEEALELQTYSENKFGLGENPQLCVKGQVVNDLALELDLIDPDWYLVKKCNLIQTSKSVFDPQKDKETNLKLYQELGIDPSCGKQPFVFTDAFRLNGYIDEDELQLLVNKAKTLIVSSSDNEDYLPSERRSVPMSLTRMAQYWGGDMTPRKLKAMIKIGSIKVEKINRQTFVFDISKLPVHVQAKVTK
ncbi:MAG: hypothetical protein ACYS3S_25800 [Planctomycetota bacterium]|jgi:hypothetical protein